MQSNCPKERPREETDSRQGDVYGTGGGSHDSFSIVQKIPISPKSRFEMQLEADLMGSKGC